MLRAGTRSVENIKQETLSCASSPHLCCILVQCVHLIDRRSASSLVSRAGLPALSARSRLRLSCKDVGRRKPERLSTGSMVPGPVGDRAEYRLSELLTNVKNMRIREDIDHRMAEDFKVQVSKQADEFLLFPVTHLGPHIHQLIKDIRPP